MMRDLVLGLEVVRADGAVLTMLNAMLKDNAGYDLKQLFIGSEGTLGVVTQAVLRLFPAPRTQATALLAMDDFAPVSYTHLDVYKRQGWIRLAGYGKIWRNR